MAKNIDQNDRLPVPSFNAGQVPPTGEKEERKGGGGRRGGWKMRRCKRNGAEWEEEQIRMKGAVRCGRKCSKKNRRAGHQGEKTETISPQEG